ncbi:MAG: site-specific integrase [Oscillospiraceae bacterium]|nr:site-specific integrase [Oscillospiraceae bacterium]
MASHKMTTDAQGNTVYKVQASNGRGRKVTRSWRPEPSWSARTIERELNKFKATLEKELASGKVLTRQEQLERDRQAALEAAKIKTLRQYTDGVFMPRKELSFSENSKANYRQMLDKHILPVLGNIPMGEITPAMLDSLLLNFQKQGYAHSSCAKMHMILGGIFKMARKDSTISSNPMELVDCPAARKDEHIQDESEKAFTVQELTYILDCLQHEPLKWQAYVHLVSDTGLRRGEACGLQWADVDWKSSTITVRHNLQYTKSAGVYLTNPKNGKARTVDIGPDVIELLKQLRTEQATKCISKYVFSQESSPEPMNPQTPTRYFKKPEKRYGIKDFHPHKLRHTSASISLTHGGDLVSVSQRLGHSDTAVTLRMYAHANSESIRRAGQAVRDALKAQGE